MKIYGISYKIGLMGEWHNVEIFYTKLETAKLAGLKLTEEYNGKKKDLYTQKLKNIN